MILFDTPRPVDFRRFTTTAHMMSDRIGEEGTRELLAFGARIGLWEHWIQRRGEPTEHFDLFDGAVDRARACGAVEVTPRELVLRVVFPKRAAARGEP